MKAQGKCSAGRAAAGELPFSGEVKQKDSGRPPEKAICRTKKAGQLFVQHVRPFSVPFSGIRPLLRARPQTSKFYPSPKEIPRREPPGVPYLPYSMQSSGACAGERSRRGGPEGPASPEEAGLSKVFFSGEALAKGALRRGRSGRGRPPRGVPLLKRPTPPRSSSPANITPPAPAGLPGVCRFRERAGRGAGGIRGRTGPSERQDI